MSNTEIYLAGAVFPHRDGARAVSVRVALVLTGVALLAVSAHLRIPFYPVPFTMQTFVVLVVGVSYGPALSGATVALYLLVGAAGAPVFSGGASGVGHLAGPTAGYLFGFLVAALLVGRLQRSYPADRWTRVLGTMLLGTGVIFAVGLAWLAHLFGFVVAVREGLAPFVASELAKIGLAVAVLPGAWSVVNQRR